MLVSTLLLAMSSCMWNGGLTTASQSERNIDNLARLSAGMNRDDVMHIMHRPYSTQTFTMEGIDYEVWFYVTRATVLGQSRMVPHNLTPLTFKEGELIGIGFDYYNYLVKYKEDQEHPKKKAPEKKEPEHKSLEDVLNKKTPPQTKQAAPQKEPENKSLEDVLNKKAPEKKETSMTRSEEKPEPPSCPECNRKPEEEQKKEGMPAFDEQDRKMQEEEQEENFDYW